MLSLNLILAVLIGAAGVWFWHRSLTVRERANRAAMQACERMNLQFLDGTVAFARLRLTRGVNGWLQLQRSYIFDYTASSIERRQGFIVMSGDAVESIGFAPDVEARSLKSATDNVSVTPVALPPVQVQSPSTPPAANSNVLDLAEWRRKHQQRDKNVPPDNSRNTWQ